MAESAVPGPIRGDSPARGTGRTPEERLAELGLELPEPPRPVAAYVPWTRVGELLFTAGQIPVRDGEVVHRGKVGRDLTPQEGYEAARLCCLNALAVVRAAVGDLGRVAAVVRLDGYVNSAPGFTDQPRVLNGASELLLAVFREAGRHARLALGVSELPLDAAVELALLVAVAPAPAGR